MESYEDIQSFLSLLFGTVIPDESRVLIWTKKPNESFYFTSVEEAADTALSLAASRDVYVGCGLRRIGLSVHRRGGNTDVVQLHGFHADIDYGSRGSGKNYFPDETSALRFLKSCPAVPTIVISTGGGLHAWWLFKEPWELFEESERSLAAETCRVFGRALVAAAKVRGHDIDYGSDLAKVLRLPNTLNYKYGTPRQVKTAFSSGITYPDWREILHEMGTDPEVVTAPTEAGVRKLLSEKLSAESIQVLQADKRAKSLLNGELAGMPSVSEGDLALADHASNKRLTPGQAKAALRERRLNSGEKTSKVNLESFGDREVEKAFGTKGYLPQATSLRLQTVDAARHHARFLRQNDVSAEACLILIEVASYSADGLSVQVAQSALIENVNLSRQAVSSNLKKFFERGCLSRDQDRKPAPGRAQGLFLDFLRGCPCERVKPALHEGSNRTLNASSSDDTISSERVKVDLPKKSTEKEDQCA